MLDRRQFLQLITASAAAGMLGACRSSSSGPVSNSQNHLDRIGLGLFSIPKLLNEDFEGTMKTLAQIGYKEIEFFGPYPFSAPEAQERWKPVGAALGIQQTGHFGRTPQQVKEILDRNGLTSPSMHTDMDTLRTRMSELAEAAHVLGQRYVILPSAGARPNLDGYKRLAEEFNAIGAQAEKAGIRFAYHNHGYGLTELEGQIPFNLILEQTDPKLVDLQMDIYWMAAGGQEPAAYFEAYPGRFRLMHIKDMSERVRFSGDGGDSQQWVDLFPFIADAGSGVFDLQRIISSAKKSGVQHFLVERDLAPNPTETLQKSYQFLSSLNLEA